VKSRGTSYDGDVHKFTLSDDGIMVIPNDNKTKFSNNKKKVVHKNDAENEENQ
jgi:hypothetical protein